MLAMAPVSSLILLLSTIFNLPGKFPAPGGIRVFASVGQHGDVCNASNSDTGQSVCDGGLAPQGPAMARLRVRVRYFS
jgi:hypothetical protein